MILTFHYKGAYKADTTYNVGSVVPGADGALMYYVNATPAAGHATDDPDYWLPWGEPGTPEYDMLELRLARQSFASLDARLDDLLTRINERCAAHYGVYTGLVVAQQTVAAMSVKVSAGTIHMANGDRFTPAAVAEVEIDEADETNGRIDIVYVDDEGAVSYLAGTAGAEPAAPATPEGGLVLAEITVDAQATTIVTAKITDKRRLVTA